MSFLISKRWILQSEVWCNNWFLLLLFQSFNTNVLNRLIATLLRIIKWYVGLEGLGWVKWFSVEESLSILRHHLLCLILHIQMSLLHRHRLWLRHVQLGFRSSHVFHDFPFLICQGLSNLPFFKLREQLLLRLRQRRELLVRLDVAIVFEFVWRITFLRCRAICHLEKAFFIISDCLWWRLFEILVICVNFVQVYVQERGFNTFSFLELLHQQILRLKLLCLLRASLLLDNHFHKFPCFPSFLSFSLPHFFIRIDHQWIESRSLLYFQIHFLKLILNRWVVYVVEAFDWGNHLFCVDTQVYFVFVFAQTGQLEDHTKQVLEIEACLL